MAVSVKLAYSLFFLLEKHIQHAIFANLTKTLLLSMILQQHEQFYQCPLRDCVLMHAKINVHCRKLNTNDYYEQTAYNTRCECVFVCVSVHVSVSVCVCAYVNKCIQHKADIRKSGVLNLRQTHPSVLKSTTMIMTSNTKFATQITKPSIQMMQTHNRISR